MEGYEQGEECGRNGCKGIIQEKVLDDGCSCHIAPPCSYCTTPKEYCPVCDWDAEEESQEKRTILFMEQYPKAEIKEYRSWQYTPKDTKYKGDDLKPIWNVCSYWDDIFDNFIYRGLTREEADLKKDKYKSSIYTSFGVTKGDKEY